MWSRVAGSTHVPDYDNFALMDVVPLICQVEVLPTINISADINNLRLILNVQLKLAGKVLQVFDLGVGERLMNHVTAMSTIHNPRLIFYVTAGDLKELAILLCARYCMRLNTFIVVTLAFTSSSRSLEHNALVSKCRENTVSWSKIACSIQWHTIRERT